MEKSHEQESDSGETGDDDEEEVEVEPKLRYERLKNDVPVILKKDAASCFALHTKFLCIGTHLGIIHILDHQGNNIRGKEIVSHATTVNQINVDEKGDYIASCSNDGKVVLHGMYSSDFDTVVTIDRPVRAVALDPKFSKSSSNRRFVIGEEKVILYERLILTRFKSTILYRGEGPIRNIQWKDHFVVWASDKTIRLYDLLANGTVTVIQKDFDSILRPDLYRCNFFWKDNKSLLIAWGNSVKVCNVVANEPQQKAKSHPTIPKFYVEITSLFNTDFCICGISSIGDNVVVLTVAKGFETHGNIGVRPQLKILQPEGEDFKLISSDILSLHGYPECRCNDYHLNSLSEEGFYFILSPKDFVVATARDQDDHITWLIKHHKYEEALTAVQEDETLRKYTPLKVGQLYFDYLFHSKRYNEAAKLCPSILGSDQELWDNEVFKFAHVKQLRSVAPYLPVETYSNPAIYEMVLNDFLLNDPKGFLSLIRTWPCHIYSIPVLINATNLQLTKQPCLELYESLCELYIFNKNYNSALNIYIEIKNKDKIFDLIRTYGLYECIIDKLDILMELNAVIATNMFMEHLDKISIDLVISKLSHKSKLLFEYLQKVSSKDPNLVEDYNGLMVKLYAEYLPEELLAFLRSSNNYALEYAYDICQQRNFVPEMVFLLSRMGNTKQALQKIIFDLQDIEQAITFCKEHDDRELWECLVEYSINKSHFIAVLLQNIGTHVDPIMLIQKIPCDKEIPGLRDSLVKILQDYNLQISLREGCEKILVADCFSLLEKLNKHQTKGILVNENQICYICHGKLLANDFNAALDIFVFNCRHGFHKNCISYENFASCLICCDPKEKTRLLYCGDGINLK